MNHPSMQGLGEDVLLIRNCCSGKAGLFCHHHTALHFQAFGDFTTFSLASPGWVSLTYYVMISQGLGDKLLSV